MTFEKKFRVETPYGVKNFLNFHLQKHAPNMQKRLAKKFQQNSIQPPNKCFISYFKLVWLNKSTICARRSWQKNYFANEAIFHEECSLASFIYVCSTVHSKIVAWYIAELSFLSKLGKSLIHFLTLNWGRNSFNPVS